MKLYECSIVILNYVGSKELPIRAIGKFPYYI